MGENKIMSCPCKSISTLRKDLLILMSHSVAVALFHSEICTFCTFIQWEEIRGWQEIFINKIQCCTIIDIPGVVILFSHISVVIGFRSIDLEGHGRKLFWSFLRWCYVGYFFLQKYLISTYIYFTRIGHLIFYLESGILMSWCRCAL